MPNTSIIENIVLFQDVIGPKLRRMALRLAGGDQAQAQDLLAVAGDRFASRHHGGAYAEAQLVRLGRLQLRQAARDARAHQLARLDDVGWLQPASPDRLQRHLAGRMSQLEAALEQGADEATRSAVDLIWGGASIADAARVLGLTASCLHKRLRALGRMLLAEEVE